MNKMRLYHGSECVIEKPELARGKEYNDYGRGFYCTEHDELAKEWACAAAGRDGFANEYLLDMQGLSVLDLSDDAFCILHWLAILLEHRIVDLSLPVAQEGSRFLAEHFHVDISPFDVIVGYRADDSYFSFARAFLQNAISVEQLSKAMRLGKLGEQVVLKSERAFERIRFVTAHVAPSDVYHARRKSRDEEARATFRTELEKQDLEGLYLRDVIREGVEASDERLR